MAFVTTSRKDNVGIAGAALWPALALAAFVFIATAIALYAPPTRGEMAVVFPFGTDDETAYQLVLEAGGNFVGPTRLPNIVVAFASDEGFGDRIRNAGALLLLAAQGLCGPLPPEPSTT